MMLGHDVPEKLREWLKVAQINWSVVMATQSLSDASAAASST